MTLIISKSSHKSRTQSIQKKKKMVPRRRQSIIGHKLKKYARERIEDIPCPLPDDLFNEETCTCGAPSTLSLAETGQHTLDIFKNICDGQEQEQKGEFQHQQSAKNSNSSASTQSIQSSTSSAIQYSSSSSKSSQNTNHIKREVQIALMKRVKPSGINKEGVISNPELVRENSDEQGSDLDSSYVSFSVSMQSNEDGSDCCSHIWDGLVKLTALLIRLGNYAAEHEMLAYPLAAIAFYVCLGLLQPMIASLIAALTGWIWPPLHFFLVSTAGFVWRVADWLNSMDQLGRNMICDMAANYCRHYRLLCDHQCSFVDRAIDGVRTSRNCLG